jgi:hypothetical protein
VTPIEGGAIPARAPARITLPALANLLGPPATVESDTAIEATAVQLSPMAALWRRLLSEHGPDPAGKCRM